MVIVSGRDWHASDGLCPSLCQKVAKGEDEQSVEHVQRPQPTRIKLRVYEERLQKHEQEECQRQADDGPAHAANDRGEEHQDRYEVEDDEPPLPVRFQAFAAQDAKAGQEKLDCNGENKQPGEPDEDLARHTQLRVLRRLNKLAAAANHNGLAFDRANAAAAMAVDAGDTVLIER